MFSCENQAVNCCGESIRDSRETGRESSRVESKSESLEVDTSQGLDILQEIQEQGAQRTYKEREVDDS